MLNCIANGSGTFVLLFTFTRSLSLSVRMHTSPYAPGFPHFEELSPGEIRDFELGRNCNSRSRTLKMKIEPQPGNKISEPRTISVVDRIDSFKMRLAEPYPNDVVPDTF